MKPPNRAFTQEDPIGIAGGLNLYGYANGDPINFSDPFGLCPDEDDTACQVFESGLTALGAALGFLAGGGTGSFVALASSGVGAAAVPAGAVQGAAAGGFLGAALGKALSPYLFSEGNDDGVRRKPGSQGRFKSRDAIRAENRVVRDVVRRLGLSKGQQRRLHREISGQGMDYHEILETARSLFGGGL